MRIFFKSALRMGFVERLFKINIEKITELKA